MKLEKSVMLEENKTLTILDASAGSGKTFRLVKEYLTLLFEGNEDENRFARIIAMTFTNKAAIEMKTRIIKALDEVANYEKLGHNAKKYAENLSAELNMALPILKEKSKKSLENILHKYEDFSVMTIDKFNLKLIRSFSKDLDLPSDFEIVLNEDLVIEQIVDNLLNSLGQADKETLTKLIFSYAKSNLEDGLKWNFRDSLINFAKIITQESNLEQIELLLQEEFTLEEFEKIKHEIANIEDQLKTLSQQTYTTYLKYELQKEDFPGKSNTYKLFDELPENKFNKKFSDGFIKSVSKDPPKGKFFPEELRETTLKLIEYLETNFERLVLLRKFKSNFFNMSLLKFLAEELVDFRTEERLIRISEFNTLISKLVQNENAPFIYSRIGVRYMNYLLDEFQDTSRLQWLNMIPLVHNSLSERNKNLIVGDAKQSIYRFKNGVAEQFVSLPDLFNPERSSAISQYSKQFNDLGVKIPLKDNWRSGTEIVNFNNRFFKKLKNYLPEEGQAHYSSIEQNPKAEFGGYIEIMSQLKDKEQERSALIDQITDKIESCLSDGFLPGDICILTEVNKTAVEYSIGLSQKGYKIVSPESLLLKSNQQVKLALTYLTLRLKPSSETEMKKFMNLFFRNSFPKEHISRYKSYFEEETRENKSIRLLNHSRFITEHFQSESNFFYPYENLYDLIQKFYLLMGWNEIENPYLHHLADFIFEYEINRGPDLLGLLEYFDQKKEKIAIQLPESSAAIKIMTAHKSKGLEFPVVILPDIDFKIAISTKAKFLIPVRDHVLHVYPKKDDEIPEISAFNLAETQKILLDKINLCYVAFTRPVERLYVINNYTKNSLGATLHACFTETLENSENQESAIWTIGMAEHKVSEHSKIESSFFTPKNIADHLWFPEIAIRDTKNLSVEDGLSEEKNYGRQFHFAVSQINKDSEIADKLNAYVQQGIVDSAFRDKISIQLKRLFSNNEYASLLEDLIEVLDEKDIIADEQNMLRPDKIVIKRNKTIVIDFKTGLPKAKDRKQVENYVNILQDMGNLPVEGYLLYVGSNELVQVK